MGCGQHQEPSRGRCPLQCRGHMGCSQPYIGKCQNWREKKAGQNMRLLEPHSIPHGLHGEHRSLGGQGHTLHRSQEQESQCSPWRQGMVLYFQTIGSGRGNFKPCLFPAWYICHLIQAIQGGLKCKKSFATATTNLQMSRSTVDPKGKKNGNTTKQQRFKVPWYKDELAVAVEGLVEDDPVLASSHPVSDIASFNLADKESIQVE